ncbi:hypothetical protein C1G87_0615 [Dehalococcoides mccartyi]|uniref:Uncharacterized protein n=1 Tax=Dehalococcoides mccartyi TaxID=61435 RepID=A0A328EPT0_9CHLR|nr:hypothetical protein dcmb_652 [Dehalococcoides mccartyi DCMB5]AGG07711.1 hypothetical protein btf_606 [Dehalococcoides mccartyi BTF08]AOV99241.1 hypothetical protein DCWBC2_0580 [Dehalococcoides mccartyi]MBA2085022.1 hypothetical protein [Dehalococcoides mccartyi]RAL69588.1 hypothetical protein C1G87_0615 [Dehalococcoides mccartyi]
MEHLPLTAGGTAPEFHRACTQSSKALLVVFTFCQVQKNTSASSDKGISAILK